MKNLFDFATKELAQDAFLRWLFENYECENKAVEECALRLLREFSGITGLKKEQVHDLTTLAQWNKIDVTVLFKVEDEAHLIAIEDKTGSKEHNQLDEYNGKLKENCDEKGHLNDKKFPYPVPSENAHKIFYKTWRISEEERARVEKAQWSLYDIDGVCALYAGIGSTGDEILDNYLQHVRATHQALGNTALPDQQGDTLPVLARWIGFFAHLAKSFGQHHEIEIDIARYGYAFLAVFSENQGKRCPYLEFRSRDIDAGKKQFSAFVITYLMYDNIEKESDRKQYRDRAQKVISVPLKNGKEKEGNRYFFRTRKGEEPKTLARTEPKTLARAKDIQFEDEDDLIRKMAECLAEYDEYMKNW